jgi:hypothetical protein
VLAAMLSLPAVANAAPQVKIPDCPTLVQWGGTAAPGQVFNPAPRLQLSKAFEDATLVPLFGVPVLSWTPEDAQAVSQALVQCFQEANQRRDQASAGALANANRALGAVPPTNAAAQKARVDAEAAKKQLDALPDSPELGRVVDGILKGNPAAPDGNVLRGAPREIGEPSFHIMQAVTMLPDADRATLYQSLAQRRDAIVGKQVGDAEQTIAKAPEDAGGILAIIQLRAGFDAVSDEATRAKLRKSADDRADQIRAALRQAKPAVLVPPNCADLYKWSGGPGATQATQMGGRNVMAAFADERVVPVFGLSVADWSDDDLAHLKTLRGICQAATPHTIPGPGAPPDFAQLVQLADRGRWIEGADQQIADARAGTSGYRKAHEAVEANLAKIAQLPDTPQSIVALAQIASDPALAQVTQDDRNKVANAVNAKRGTIAAQATDAAIKGLGEVQIASLTDVDKLFAYLGQALQTIPDPRGQQALRDAFNQRLQQTTAKLVPEYKAKLASTPPTLAEIAAMQLKLLQLETAPFGVVNTPTYQTYFRAMQDGRDAMVASVHKKNCAEYASSVGAGSEAAEPVWEGRDPVALGDFLCEIAEHGTVNSYAGPGMFSSTTTLKVTPLKSQMFTISMHKVEVQQGKPMLVGFEVKDAAQAGGQSQAATGQAGYATMPNGPITVEGWELFIPNIVGLNGAESEACTTKIENPSPDALPVADRVFWLHCWTFADVRARYAKLHVAHQ